MPLKCCCSCHRAPPSPWKPRQASRRPTGIVVIADPAIAYFVYVLLTETIDLYYTFSFCLFRETMLEYICMKYVLKRCNIYHIKITYILHRNRKKIDTTYFLPVFRPFKIPYSPIPRSPLCLPFHRRHRAFVCILYLSQGLSIRWRTSVYAEQFTATNEGQTASR